MAEEKGKVVAVTGATGYLAGHVIKQLLEKGYCVRGTVRNISNKEKSQHLMDMASKLEGELELFEADLVKKGSFDKVTAGADVVIHTASPFQMGVKNPEETLLKPAVEGTIDVLTSCKKSGTVKKVVLTSSVAAIEFDGKVPKGQVPTFTEEDWNTTSGIKYEAYSLSKVRAEKAAWDFVKDIDDFSLVTVNPSLIVGPVLSKGSLGSSVGIIKSIVSGEYPRAPNLNFCIVDVRDVAKAHIIAMENEDIKGQRYICSTQGSMSCLEVATVLKKNFPNMPIPTKSMPNFVMYVAAVMDSRLTWGWLSRNLNKKFMFDNSKIKKDMEVEFRDIEESLVDTVNSLVEFGFVNKK